MSKEIECLFGYHNYIIPWKEDKDVLICENCKRVGYCKDSWGGEIWYAYDEKGNMLHRKDSNGYEVWYDEKGNMLHRKDSNGDEFWYDEKGNMIRRKDSDGFEARYAFDEKGNKIHYRNSSGFEGWYVYDEKGNRIHYKDSYGHEGWRDSSGWLSKKPKNWKYENV